MEIKCKVSFTLPEDLIEALGIDEDTPIIASVSGNRILLEIQMRISTKTIPTASTTFTTALTMTADRTVPATNVNTSARTAATVFSCEGGECHE